MSKSDQINKAAFLFSVFPQNSSEMKSFQSDRRCHFNYSNISELMRWWFIDVKTWHLYLMEHKIEIVKHLLKGPECVGHYCVCVCVLDWTVCVCGCCWSVLVQLQVVIRLQMRGGLDCVETKAWGGGGRVCSWLVLQCMCVLGGWMRGLSDGFVIVPSLSAVWRLTVFPAKWLTLHTHTHTHTGAYAQTQPCFSNGRYATEIRNGHMQKCNLLENRTKT